TRLNVWADKSQSVWFRTLFQIPAGSSGAEIKVRALHDVKVFVDGILLFQSDPNTNWKVAHRIELPAGLGVRQHGLILIVGNPRGPALTLVAGPKLNIRSNGSWESSEDGMLWVPAVVADAPKDPP